VPGEWQPGTSHRCCCLCRPPGTAMAGDGELNRIIKDLQSKCASLSPASVSPAWHTSPWPCQVPLRTQPAGSRGVSLPGGALKHLSANLATAACSRPRCQPQGTGSAQRVPVPLAPPAPPFHPRAGSSFARQQKSPGLGAGRLWGRGVGRGRVPAAWAGLCQLSPAVPQRP